MMIFAEESNDGYHSEMNEGERILAYIISIFSLIISIFLIYVTVKKIKMNLMQKLILHIIISEIIDEVNIILSLFIDIQDKNFESYSSRMHICFTQIYLGVFTCLWTLTASFLISLKLYDIIIKKNQIFKENSFMGKHAIKISIFCPFVISYIFWFSQVLYQVNQLTPENKYISTLKRVGEGTEHYRMIYCWVNTYISIVIAIIALTLIGGNIYFSFVKGYCFVRQTKQSLAENNDSLNVKEKVEKIGKIQKTLFLYPFLSCIEWILFFLMKLIFTVNSELKNGSFLSWFFTIVITSRQVAYILSYFLTQEKLKSYTYRLITCKECKGNQIPSDLDANTIQPINSEGSLS